MTDQPVIRLLDEQTANQIAAGEVVERPASVVKELCENSLDAGARRILVAVADGGRRRLQVTDDGMGLSPGDAALALQRHATSKIRTAADLATVATLGFRGEALPSVAAVSRFSLVSRRPGDPAAVRGECAGGHDVRWTTVGAPHGTTVTVEDLFFNTPARLKFLRSARSELHHVVKTVLRLALSRPEVAFQLRADERAILSTPGSGDLLDAIRGALGPELADSLLPLPPAATERDLAVTGYVGRPDAARGNRQQQFFFIDGRPVRSLALGYALEEAYRGLLAQGRYPVAVVHIRVPPGTVDVNVHPTKDEVRFEQEQQVRSAVYHAVQQALAGAVLVPGHRAPAPRPQPDVVRGAPERPEAGATKPRGSFAPAAPAVMPALSWAEQVRPYLAERLAAATAPAPIDGPAVPADPDPAAVIRRLRPLAQALGAYLVCDGPEGLYLVDQHAAHERVYFDQFAAGDSAAARQAQYLALPLDLELNAAEMALWEEHSGEFAGLGLVAEPFGGNTLLIKAVPPRLSRQPQALVRDILDYLADGRAGTQAMDAQLAARRALAACKAAIKANDPLSIPAAQALLDALADASAPFTCPHGRPTIICLSHSELERRFRRKA